MFNLKVLSREVTEAVLTMPEVIETVEEVYKLKAKGDTVVFPLVSHEFNPGVSDMDIKSGLLCGSDIFGLKVVSWFSDNRERNLPALIGTIMVMDAKTGVPMGILDGSYITGMRTGAAGAIGAKALARAESETLLMVGTGTVAKFEVAAALSVFPDLKRILVYGRNQEHAEEFANAMPEALIGEFHLEREDVKFDVVTDLAEAAGKSDIIITATPSHEPLIMKEWVKPGTHFSCVGSDMTGKQELDPEIFADARVFTDDTPQCIKVGEIEMAVAKGILPEEKIAGEIGEVLLGQTAGRENPEQITVFDATGTALLDLLTAKLALAKAEELGLGQTVDL